MKCTCIILYTCTVHCTIRTRAQSVRRQHRKRASEKSDLLTYKDYTQVDRKKWVNQHAKKGDSKAILMLIVVNVTYTVHCIIRIRAQSDRRQHRKRTSEKNEMVIYNDSTQLDRNMWVSFSWIKPLGRMGHNVLKWLVIYLLNKLALC